MNHYKQYSFDNDVYFDDLIEILLETNDYRALQLVVLANNIGMPTRKPIHLYYDVVSVEYADNLEAILWGVNRFGTYTVFVYDVPYAVSKEEIPIIAADIVDYMSPAAHIFHIIDGDGDYEELNTVELEYRIKEYLNDGKKLEIVRK